MTRIRRDAGCPGCWPARLRRKITDGASGLASGYGSHLHGAVLRADSGVTA